VFFFKHEEHVVVDVLVGIPSGTTLIVVVKGRSK